MNIEPTYKINGSTVQFSVKDYLSKSMGISRDEMPQVNMDKLISLFPTFQRYITILEIDIPVNELLPTQSEINYGKVLLRMANGDPIYDPIFICDRNYHIIDGHHRHVQALIENPDQLAKVYMFDLEMDELFELLQEFNEVLNPAKDINDNIVEACDQIFASERVQQLIEDYGMQGPEASPGMGDTNFGKPTTADQTGENGSGDIPGGMKVSKNKKDDDPLAKMKKFLEAFGTEIRLNEDGYKEMRTFVEGKWTPWEVVGQKQLTENFNSLFNLKLEALIEFDNIIDLVIESAEDISDNIEPRKVHFTKDIDKSELVQCVNIPVLRYCKKIDSEFSCATLEGITYGKKGDYLMVGVDGEVYPCDADIFHKTYLIYNDKQLATDENGMVDIQEASKIFEHIKNNS